MAMSKFDSKRLALSEVLADYVLANGLQQSSLRDLAKAVSTSDRMLLHYFENKEELMTEVMVRIAERLIALLETARLANIPPHKLIATLSAMMDAPELQPYLNITVELVAQAGSSGSYYKPMTDQIFDIFYDWIRKTIAVPVESLRDQQAAFVFAVIEGFAVLGKVGRRDLIGRAMEIINDTRN